MRSRCRDHRWPVASERDGSYQALGLHWLASEMGVEGGSIFGCAVSPPTHAGATTTGTVPLRRWMSFGLWCAIADFIPSRFFGNELMKLVLEAKIRVQGVHRDRKTVLFR